MSKMWPQFLINLSNNIKFVVVVLAATISISQSHAAEKKEETPPAGLYENYLELLQIGKDSYSTKVNKLKNAPSNLTDLKDLNSIDIDPDYIGHILTYTPARYSYLGTKDNCSFYDLFLANIVRDYNGPVDYVIVRYLTKAEKKKRAYVKLDTFIQNIAIPKCPKIKTFQAYFELKNFGNTVKAIKMPTPATMGDCNNIHKEFIDDHKTPYLCSINDEIQNMGTYERNMKNTSKSNPRLISHWTKKFKNAQAYRSRMNKRGLRYLENICENIEDRETFCDNFFSKNYWQRVLDGERTKWTMTGLCQGVLQRDTLNDNNYKVCARNIARDSNSCQLSGLHFPALHPKPACDKLETALNYSRMKTEYQDCPAKTGNLSIVNIARILQHFYPQEDKEKSYCALTSANTFLNFNAESVESRTWNINLCYEDKINEKEVCLPTLNGDYGDSEFSLGTVTAKIMERTRGTDKDMKCLVVPKRTYNPNLLKYKNGCFVIYEQEFCTSVKCDLKFIYQEREIKHITHKQDVQIDYLPNNTKYEKFSQLSLLKEYKGISEKKIINVTILKTFLNKYPNGIIHAVGCMEDIYPGQFNVQGFNQCTPTPMLIDGYIEKKGLYSLIVRTALDDIQSPRIIPWNNIYRATKGYQRIHPMKVWSLNGLYIK